MSLLWRPVHAMAKAWAQRRTANIPHAGGAETLKHLLRKAKDTAFGRDFGFAEILDYDDVYPAFCERVPVIDYAAWIAWLGSRGPLTEAGPRPLVDVAWPGKIDIFCLSSGTTSGRTKYVPYSQQMADVNRRAALDFFAHIVSERPALVPLHHRTLYMSGSTNVKRNDEGALCGDMSGLTKYLAPKMLSRFTLPPRSISSLDAWQDRLNALVNLCLNYGNLGAISGIPIWQLTLLEKISHVAGKTAGEAMPNLRYLIHGGMSLDPYRERMRELAGPNVRFLEIYAASETGITAYQLPGEQGMRFQESYDVFYEFEDEAGHIVHSGQVEKDRRYTLLISSCSGLWRYRIGDVVVFNKTAPLTIAYVTRDKTTSAFDEKVTEKELENAMTNMHPCYGDYAMGPDTDKRRHTWFIIGNQHPGTDWVNDLDRKLRQGNEDYDDYRSDGRIDPPRVVMVTDRAAFLETIGRDEGGQRKFPRLLASTEVAQLNQRFSRD